MPSPFGHALAGIATAWAADDVPVATPQANRPNWTLTLVCMLLAVLPDLDLLYTPIHRRISHSIGAVVIVLIVSAAVTRWVTGRIAWKTAAICAAAYGSHILLDWLGADPNPPHGIQALWPFSDRFVIAGMDLFPGTERRHVFTLEAFAVNANAMFWEFVLLAPIVGAIAWMKRRRGQA